MLRFSRSAIVHISLFAFGLLIVGRAAYLQLWKGGEYSAIANRQYFRTDTIPGLRGDILDEAGRPLVQSMDRVSVSIAPKQIPEKERERVRSALAKLGVSRTWQQRSLNATGPTNWVTLPAQYMRGDVSDIRTVRGVYVEQVVSRASFASAGASALIGRVTASGTADGGIERSLDHYLRGTPGVVRLVRDPAGKRDREVVRGKVQDEIAGNNVSLTINRELQIIAERALRDAVVDQSARAGDIVIVEPATGEIRAMASYTPGTGFASTGMITDPYEPGSSVKPLLVSRLLELELATPSDSIETGKTLVVPGRRLPLSDDYPEDGFSLRGVIRESSNVGMVKFAWRLTPQQQFEAYRDFGLGMPTGVPLPGESSGRLNLPTNRPQEYQAQTAIGYFLSVTSLQLAMAYASIANGGELMEPALVREVRSASGKVIFKHSPRVVRRVMSSEVASQMRSMLRDVVAEGTASKADIDLGALAGKTGTARISGGRVGYSDNQHTATFAGMFPTDAPQFVIVVRLVAPELTYGGAAAAPVTAAVLKAAAVAQDAALDRRSLINPAVTLASGAAGDGAPIPEPVAVAEEPEPSEEFATKQADRIVLLSLSKSASVADRDSSVRAVPKVSGLPIRSAVHALHQAGFRVQVKGIGGAMQASGTTPLAGARAKRGATVVLHRGQ